MGRSVSGNVGAFRKRRFRYNCVLILLFCSATLFFLLISKIDYIVPVYSAYAAEKNTMKEGCYIPKLIPMDESIKTFVSNPDVPLCMSPEKLPLEHNKTHIWIKKKYLDQKETTVNRSISCCYEMFSRPAAIEDIDSNRIDDRVAFEKCRYFSDIIDVHEEHEFVKVRCNITNSTFQQFFLFTPKKEFTTRFDSLELSEKAEAFNVLVLGIDAVSRLNFYRTMPKTVEYLKSKGAVDLSGYNKVGDNSFPNLIPMLLGISVHELNTTCLPYNMAKFDSCPLIWEWFKQAGYYTAFGEDSSYLGTFNYLRAGFASTPTDYYLHTFINEAESYTKNQNSTDELCVNDKYYYKILLDYVQNLTDSMNSSKLFGFFWEISMSHDNLNYPMVMDNDYVIFFENLEKSNYLNNTIFFLVSDHGIRWGNIRDTKQGRIEERLPFVFVLMPNTFRNIYSEAFKNLQLNSNRLATPYDVHATLFDLIDLQNLNNDNILSRMKTSYGTKRSISLFLPIPTNRTCKMAGISDHWCTCHKEHPISNKSMEATEAAFQLTEYLNSLLKGFSECASLKLEKVLEATEIEVGKPDKDESGGWKEFLVKIETSPGGGVFEATVRNYTNLQWSVIDTVSRLNLYGNQSACVEDNQMKLYCFCI